jgi:hypothetical protein
MEEDGGVSVSVSQGAEFTERPMLLQLETQGNKYETLFNRRRQLG